MRDLEFKLYAFLPSVLIGGEWTASRLVVLLQVKQPLILTGPGWGLGLDGVTRNIYELRNIDSLGEDLTGFF
jgi:hypothetical protein